MQVDPIIEPLLRSSKLPVCREELNTFYTKEKRRRQRFYDEPGDEGKAAFIEGEGVLHSPAGHRHNECRALLLRLLAAHVNVHRLGTVTAEKALVRPTRNDFEPGICFFGRQKADKLGKAATLYPAPDFVVEILSGSAAATDRGVTFRDYAAHGVSEYWIVNAERECVEQYFLEGNGYELNVKTKDGLVVAKAVSGFSVPVKALFDKEENSTALQKILAKQLWP